MHHIDDSSNIPVFICSAIIGVVSRLFFSDVYLPLIMAVASGFLGVIAKKLGEYLFELAKKKFESWKQKRSRRKSRKAKPTS
jgi:hypothetical protein